MTIDPTTVAGYSSSLAALRSLHPVLGAALTFHRNKRRQPMTLRGNPCLIEIYARLPKCREAVVCKAVQVGLTEFLILLQLMEAAEGRIVAYIVPTEPLRDRFVADRINPLLAEVPIYRAFYRGGDAEDAGIPQARAANLRLKHFGRGTCMYMGIHPESSVIEFSADTAIIDEFDHALRANAQNVGLARDRVRESDSPRIILSGNPTIPRWGISEAYDHSDRRRWFHRCQHCGERQPIEWNGSIVEQTDSGRWVPLDVERAADPGLGDLRPVCRKCHRPYERAVAGEGGWVATSPSISILGYRVSRLDRLTQPLRDLYWEWIRAQGSSLRIGLFWRSVTGEAREEGATRVTMEDLVRSRTGAPLDHEGGASYAVLDVTAGIDVGAELHVVISVIEHGPRDSGAPDKRRVAWAGTVRTFEAAAALIRRYRVRAAVFDAAPELHKAQEIRDEFEETGEAEVWLCRYGPADRISSERYGARYDYEARVITVDRTQLLDAALDDLREGRRLWPSDADEITDLAEQLQAPVRTLDEKTGRISWVEGSAPDHYRHADAYDLVAYDLLVAGSATVL